MIRAILYISLKKIFLKINISNTCSNGGNEDLTRKKIPAERFLLIWYPIDPTYDQKKTPRHPKRRNVFFLLLFKMAALVYSEKLKNGKMINYTSFLTFLGSRNPIKILF